MMEVLPSAPLFPPEKLGIVQAPKKSGPSRILSPYDGAVAQPMGKFDFEKPPTDPIELAHKLAQAMVDMNGNWLVAPHIGLPYNVFVMGKAGDKIYALFNPRVVSTGVQQVKMAEGSLLYPGVILEIERPVSCRVRYTQPNGEVQTQDFSGLTARIVQQSVDFLQGIHFTDKVSKVVRERAFAKARKLRRKVNV